MAGLARRLALPLAAAPGIVSQIDHAYRMVWQVSFGQRQRSTCSHIAADLRSTILARHSR